MANESKATLSVEDAKPANATKDTNGVHGEAATSENSRGRPRSRRSSAARSTSPLARTSPARSHSRVKRDQEAAQNDAVPLLPSERHLPRQNPPRSGPEFEEDEDGIEMESYPQNNHGIDDGFFAVPKPRKDSDQKPTRRGSIPPNFPYAPDFGPGIVEMEGVPRIIPDVNIYQQKKLLAQGMMDLALLSANANQLRYILESYDRHPYYYFSLVFISASLVFQVAVGIGLLLNSKYNIKNDDDMCRANRLNNFITIGVLMITIINVFVSAFGVANTNPPILKT